MSIHYLGNKQRIEILQFVAEVAAIATTQSKLDHHEIYLSGGFLPQVYLMMADRYKISGKVDREYFSTILNNLAYSDIDFYFVSDKQNAVDVEREHQIVKHIRDNLNFDLAHPDGYKTFHVYQKVDDVRFRDTTHRKKIQVIFNGKFKTIQEVIRGFDVNICQMYYNINTGLKFSKGVLTALESREVIYNKNSYLFSEATAKMRIGKYKKKGFKIINESEIFT